jgi:FO synthase
MNESISRAAGTEHGQEMPPIAMEALIRSIGRVPRQRTTLYGEAPAEQQRRAFAAPLLAPVEQTPAGRNARIGGRRATAGSMPVPATGGSEPTARQVDKL